MTNKEKYKKAFDVLASSETISLEAENMMNKKQKKSFMAITTAAAIAFGTLTVCAAAYMNWNNGLSEELRLTEEQQKMLEDTGMAVFSGASCTDSGVTISAQQSITDRYYTYLSFKVEGYDLEKGKEPSFENIDITVDGQSEICWSGSFYDGMIPGPDGRAIYTDGTPIDYNQPIEGHYVREDGSLEYHMTLESKTEGFFIGKPIHVEIQNLGTAGKAEHIPDLEGKWTLDWTLGGVDTMKVFEPGREIGDTGAVVKKVEISPISFLITYDYPRTEIEEETILEDGTEIVSTQYAEAPWACGIRLKDGTLLTRLFGGGGYEGYREKTTDEYVLSYSFDRVIDVDEIEGILFKKDVLNEGEIPTEDNYYCIPLV